MEEPLVLPPVHSAAIAFDGERLAPGHHGATHPTTNDPPPPITERHTLQQIAVEQREIELERQRMACRLEKLKRRANREAREAEILLEKKRMNEIRRIDEMRRMDTLQNREKRREELTKQKKQHIKAWRSKTREKIKYHSSVVRMQRSERADRMRAMSSDLTHKRSHRIQGMMKSNRDVVTQVKGAEMEARRRKLEVKEKVHEKIRKQRQTRLMRDKIRHLEVKGQLEVMREEEKALMHRLEKAKRLHQAAEKSLERARAAPKLGLRSQTSPTPKPGAVSANRLDHRHPLPHEAEADSAAAAKKDAPQDAAEPQQTHELPTASSEIHGTVNAATDEMTIEELRQKGLKPLTVCFSSKMLISDDIPLQVTSSVSQLTENYGLSPPKASAH